MYWLTGCSQADQREREREREREHDLTALKNSSGLCWAG